MGPLEICGYLNKLHKDVRDSKTKRDFIILLLELDVLSIGHNTMYIYLFFFFSLHFSRICTLDRGLV